MKSYKYQDALKKIAAGGNFYLLFTTTWCGTCRVTKPFLEKLVQKYQNKPIEFLEVDAEEANLFRDPNSEFQVLKVPTHIIIKNGQQMHRGYEFIPNEQLSAWIDETLAE